MPPQSRPDDKPQSGENSQIGGKRFDPRLTLIMGIVGVVGVSFSFDYTPFSVTPIARPRSSSSEEGRDLELTEQQIDQHFHRVGSYSYDDVCARRLHDNLLHVAGPIAFDWTTPDNLFSGASLGEIGTTSPNNITASIPFSTSELFSTTLTLAHRRNVVYRRRSGHFVNGFVNGRLVNWTQKDIEGERACVEEVQTQANCGASDAEESLPPQQAALAPSQQAMPVRVHLFAFHVRRRIDERPVDCRRFDVTFDPYHHLREGFSLSDKKGASSSPSQYYPSTCISSATGELGRDKWSNKSQPHITDRAYDAYVRAEGPFPHSMFALQGNSSLPHVSQRPLLLSSFFECSMLSAYQTDRSLVHRIMADGSVSYQRFGNGNLHSPYGRVELLVPPAGAAGMDTPVSPYTRPTCHLLFNASYCTVADPIDTSIWLQGPSYRVSSHNPLPKGTSYGTVVNAQLKVMEMRLQKKTSLEQKWARWREKAIRSLGISQAEADGGPPLVNNGYPYTVCWGVGNSVTRSHRAAFVVALQEAGIPVATFGNLGRNSGEEAWEVKDVEGMQKSEVEYLLSRNRFGFDSIPQIRRRLSEEAFVDIMQNKCRYYFALENTYATDYISEKFYRSLGNTVVPIAIGADLDAYELAMKVAMGASLDARRTPRAQRNASLLDMPLDTVAAALPYNNAYASLSGTAALESRMRECGLVRACDSHNTAHRNSTKSRGLLGMATSRYGSSVVAKALQRAFYHASQTACSSVNGSAYDEARRAAEEVSPEGGLFVPKMLPSLRREYRKYFAGRDFKMITLYRRIAFDIAAMIRAELGERYSDNTHRSMRLYERRFDWLRYATVVSAFMDFDRTFCEVCRLRALTGKLNSTMT